MPFATLEDFMKYFHEVYYLKLKKETPGLRIGQSFMLFISKMWPKEYAEIATNYSIDCFYNDSIMPYTVNQLQKDWEGRPQ